MKQSLCLVGAPDFSSSAAGAAAAPALPYRCRKFGRLEKAFQSAKEDIAFAKSRA